MPELPEVTVISEDVAALAVGREVLRAAVFRPDVTNVEPEEFERRLVGRTLRATGRRGKIIVLDFGEVVGLVHLVISGRVLRLPEWTGAGQDEHRGSRVRGTDPWCWLSRGSGSGTSTSTSRERKRDTP